MLHKENGLRPDHAIREIPFEDQHKGTSNFPTVQSQQAPESEKSSDATATGRVNYIKLINWTWDVLRFMDGCKMSCIVLFLAIADSINKNRWSKTSVPYDYLINKCKFSKQVYLDARKWLVENGALEVQIGKNGYQMAVFDLGIAVRNQTATDTASDTADSTASDTATHTHLKTDKPKTPKQEKIKLNISFDQFWELYDHRKGKKQSESLWGRLTDEERQTAIEHVPKYKQATPDKTFRQHPKRYLAEKTFLDEVTTTFHKSANKILKPQQDGTLISF